MLGSFPILCMDYLIALHPFLSGPNVGTAFYLPVALITALLLHERRTGQLKLSLWFVFLALLLLPVTDAMSFWSQLGPGHFGFHILPVVFCAVLVPAVLLKHVSPGAAVAVLYAHVLAVDAFGGYAFAVKHFYGYTNGFSAGLGGGGWTDYLLLMPVYAIVGLLLADRVVRMLRKRFPRPAV